MAPGGGQHGAALATVGGGHDGRQHDRLVLQPLLRHTATSARAAPKRTTMIRFLLRCYLRRTPGGEQAAYAR